MASGIDTSTRIASMFRTAVAAQQKGRPAMPAAAGKPGAHSSRPSASLDSLIAGRIALVSADDPDRKSKVLRAFLEATLVAELGESLLLDPSFGTMVDAVHEQMRADPQIAAAMEQAVQLLLAPPPEGS